MIKKAIYQNFLVFFAYFIIYEIQRSTFFLVQSRYFETDNILKTDNILTGVASLVFLPHGVRVLSYIFFGPKIFFGLFTGHLATSVNFSNMIYLNVIAGFFGSICALIAIRIYIGRYTIQQISELNIKLIFLVSLLAAVLNSVFVNFSRLAFIDNFAIEFGSQVLQFIVGDILGTIVLFYLFNFIKKIIKISFY